jgi:thiol-disulfide isomerase/thioredoxin
VSALQPSHARARAALLAVAAVVAVLLTGCGRDVPASLQVGTTTVAPADREALPPVSGTTLDGAPLDVASLRGKVVVLNSWASWCAPCKDEVPDLVALAKAADPATTSVVGLNVDDERAAAVAFVRDFGMPYPSIVDGTGSILATLPGVPPKSLPSTLVIDKQGRIAARVIGPVNPQELGDIVASVGAERADS